MPEVEKERTQSAASRARLLMVDDEPLVRTTLGLQMEEAGFAVLLAESGEDALTKLDAGEAIDLIIADLSMPGMDGIMLVRAVHRRFPGLPAILLTGFATDAAESAMTGAMKGTFILLRKPVEGRLLAERVAVMLEGVAAAEGTAANRRD